MRVNEIKTNNITKKRGNIDVRWVYNMVCGVFYLVCGTRTQK